MEDNLYTEHVNLTVEFSNMLIIVLVIYQSEDIMGQFTVYTLWRADEGPIPEGWTEVPPPTKDQLKEMEEWCRAHPANCVEGCGKKIKLLQDLQESGDEFNKQLLKYRKMIEDEKSV